MSEDDYMEWLVGGKDLSYVIPMKILMIVPCIFFVLTALQTVLGVVIVLAVGAATYFIFLNMSVEYEYLFAEEGLSADRIMGKARRGRVPGCDKGDVQIMAPADSFVLKDYGRQGVKTRSFPSDRRDAKIYAMIYQKGAENYKALFEPNEKMIGAICRTYSYKVVV